MMSAKTAAAMVLDTAGVAGGIDEVRRIAERGWGDPGALSAEVIEALLAEHGSVRDAMYAIKLAAQQLLIDE